MLEVEPGAAAVLPPKAPPPWLSISAEAGALPEDAPPAGAMLLLCCGAVLNAPVPIGVEGLELMPRGLLNVPIPVGAKGVELMTRGLYDG
jgi:hypothetical protein